MVQYDYRVITEKEIYKYTTTEGGEYTGADYSVFIEVRGDSVKSTVTITTDFAGVWQELNPISGNMDKGNQKLYSNGRIEKKIFDKLEKELLNSGL
ncbi:MAG: hypothetical protein EHM58_02110 [Ignavibacteriae bacterium]|nr:MAG: hypothetical protein EHM58_02110 [Ignavibacteriota bacterium]